MRIPQHGGSLGPDRAGQPEGHQAGHAWMWRLG